MPQKYQRSIAGKLMKVGAGMILVRRDCMLKFRINGFGEIVRLAQIKNPTDKVGL
jgi:hypothetical protein